MFKRAKPILVLLFIFSPIIWVLLVGYPIKRKSPLATKKIKYSLRCYEINRLDQYWSCLKTNPSLRSTNLIKQVNKEIGLLMNSNNLLFWILLIGHFYLTFVIAKRILKSNSK